MYHGRTATRVGRGAWAALAMSSLAFAQEKSAEWDGLVLQPKTTLDQVYLLPDAQIPAYRTVMLAPLEVQFDRNWDPNSGTRGMASRIDKNDLAAIKENLATLFQEVFREELAKGGYQVVDAAGFETLLVAPAIVNLRITAPDTMSAGRSRTYTTSSGSMTLVLEARDSVSGEVLARAIDKKSARDTGMMTMTNRVTNSADARRALRAWAEALVRGLDSLREPAKTS